MTSPNIDLLQKQNTINEQLDNLVEICKRDKLPLKEAMTVILPKTLEIIGAKGVFIQTYNEELKHVAYRCGTFENKWKDYLDPELFQKIFDTFSHQVDGVTLVIQSLDCVEDVIGICSFVFDGEQTEEQVEEFQILTNTLSEQLDNYLEGIAATARKQKITMFATEALRRPIFEEGADQAVLDLSRELGLQEFILIYGDPDSSRGELLRYRYYLEGELQHSSLTDTNPEFEALLQKELVLDRDDKSFHKLLNEKGVFETPLLNGMNHSLIGKLVMKTKASGLNPDGMDVMRIFAECLCQRLVDYNRERRYLGKCFRPDDVQRLLSISNFYEKYLAPREETIVILFSDVASFTKICEKVCKSSSEIGELIDRWSTEIIKILYQHDGVFDKMVGDCIIGLFGPPFFESTMEERAKNAILATNQIVKVTEELGRELGIEDKIREAGIGEFFTTSNGIHVGPTSVGFFGPNDDYTGFSSSMNKAARLQGHAGYGEILLTAQVKELLKDQTIPFQFEGPEQIQVKNVSEPLKYYRLTD
jgi:adenylate cyclase